MQEAFEKIIDQLKAESIIMDDEAGNRAVKIIEQIAAEYNNGWIPCEPGKYPESNEYILLNFANFSVPQVGRYEKDEVGGVFYLGDEDETCISQDLIVSAWQPLPEPYQPNACTETDCPYNDGKDCPAAVGCAGHELKEPCFHRDHTEQGDKRTPMTNADLIRSMSDEELAEFMANKGGYIACCQCDFFNHDDEKCEVPSEWLCTKGYAEALIHKWLQSEVEVEE